jgi:hypothetical protein
MKKIIIVSIALLKLQITLAQFSFNGQLIQRAEFRNGYNKVIAEKQDPAAFIAQRLRVEGGYNFDKIQLYISLQDIRTWGSAPQIKTVDGYFSLYEGYAQFQIDSSWSVKLGRQELNYDNARFLGNLDWALQGRSHDFALVKFEKNKNKLHFGGGFNQDGQALSGNFFATQNQYKTAQFVRYEHKAKEITIATLFWNNGKQYASYDSVGNVKDKAVRFSQTFGISNISYKKKHTALSGFFYYQNGKDVKDHKMRAYDASLQISQNIPFNDSLKNSLLITAGAEILSGTPSNNTVAVNKSFSPMYGTNHAHNGYMDMYYVGGRHENSVGLHDIFIYLKYTINSKAFISLNTHAFLAYADIYNKQTAQTMKKNLGQELDLSAGYTFNKSFSMQMGYSQYFNTPSLDYLHGVSLAKPCQNWAYLMLIVRPNNPKKYIGLLQ